MRWAWWAWWAWWVACAARAEHERTFEVTEGAAVGALVGHIGDGLPDAGPPYTVVPVPGGAVDEDLRIDPATGEIRTRAHLDRERRGAYSLVAIPASGRNVRVLVRVLDENDNAPTFPSPRMSVRFSENTPRDVKRKLNPARDLDLGLFNTQRYDIVSGNTDDAFRLSSHRERDGVLYLDLQINGVLDRETVDSYSLVVEALDGGAPPLRGRMTVDIIIEDVNDNPPTFDRSSYSATVAENATVGTSVVRVFATDADAGENGEVEYSINRRQSDRAGAFRIDPVSGEISVDKPLDFETEELHELVVVARDRGLQPLETTAFVSIRVTDVNDNRPTIGVIFLSDDATPKISEAARPGDFVARISVHDPDSKTEYSDVNVTLSGGDGRFGLTTRDKAVYLVIASLPLDRETRASYELTVVATDAGSPPLRASRLIELAVTDVNDNAPEFEQTLYRGNVSERAEPGAAVTRVRAHDRDAGANAAVRYSLLVDAHSDWFAVDELSGLVTTRTRVDCETDAAPRLRVLARDLGRPSLSATATLVVTILDVNDNEPIFDQSFYNVSVPENEPVGRCILKVSATDPDCGVNAVVNYTLGEGFGKLSEFKLNSDTGELCIALELDYETRNIYEFPVIAMDRGSFATTAMIKIQLTDINDNHPVFYPREYNVSLREGNPSLTNEPILRVAATDSDSGRFGQLTYRISSGNDAGLFKIDRASGELSLARPTTLLARGQPVHRLNISAADGGGFRSVEDAEVFITIVDAAQSPPIFDSPQYQFTVSEDSKPGTYVGGVKATSIAGGHQQKVQYSIYSGDPDGYFAIDPKSGSLRTNSFLDREVKANLLLNVQATSGNPPSYGHTQVNIEIGDVNDNAPEFESSTVRISVAESAAAGAAVYAAHARDADAGRNGTVAYRLAGGPRDLFAVHPTLGHVTLLKPLDYENVIRHWLVITATDGGTPPLSANLTLQVEVQDVNDNPPVFETKNNIEAEVLESEPINTKILQVAALDRDTGNNARITYKLSSEAESEGSFGIESSSGWLYVHRNLDRESRDSYRLKVTATDGGSPPAAATATVLVKILDANDNEPTFEKEAYRFVVEENRNGGARVGAMRATDADLGNNAAIRYSLLPGNTSFHVDSSTGIITTKSPLDREFRSQYDLVAEARDQGVPPRATRVPVHITVTDVNDNRPEMVDPREDVISVREEQPSGTEVARVRAIDKDNGYNATIKYSIDKGSSDIFSIDSMTGVIKTKRILDHEESPIYDIWVTAIDSGIPSLNVTRRLRVDVLDINDNRPTFTSSSLVFKVREDAKIGHIVGAVACCDENSENNINNGSSRKLVTYTLISLTNDYVSGTFDIDRGTGSLVVARQLDRETQGEYSLEVRALDTSTMNNPQSSAVTVKVEITDVNDNAPKWPIDPITITIPEDTPPGSTIYNFTASDRDIGPNGDVRYKLLGSSTNNSDIFSVDPLTGTLSLMAHLDYESISEYMLVVKANDLAPNVSERRDTSVTVQILVLDSNDNSPFFVSSDKAVIVYNINSPASTSLYQAIAVDEDSGDNGRVTYKISAGNDNGYFAMNYDSGIISLVKPLNKVRKKLEHVLNITASDHGKPDSRKAYLTLNLTFHESTNVLPTFTQSLYKVNVSEDKRVGLFVTRISVKSHGHNSGKTLFSIPEGVAENKFAIDAQSGTITVKAALDREMCDTYTFPVYLTDVSQRRSSMHFDMSTVMITVMDVNDNEPKFKPGSCYPLSIPENNKLDVIHTVVANDKDIGNNGAITYSITSGNMGNKFSIDSTTGHLTARPLDRESQSRYRLVITARDHGTPVPLQGSCNITILIQDKNDNDPKFEVSHYSAVIAEDVPIDTSVLKVRAFDPDLKLNAQIVYSLANESQWLFKIDNKTGIITTAGYFDRERQSKYSFMVVATDSGRFDARSQKVPVDITISDVNDNKPIFTEYPFSGRVAVLSQLGFSVLKVSASDKDIDNNAEIVYSLADKASNEKFSINPTTGVLTTKQSLTSDNGKLFHLEVLARDKGNPPQMATGLIEIRVGDIPYGTSSLNFQKKSYSVNLEENAPTGKDIVQVTAVRSDGRRQRIFYSFGSGNEEYAFRIEETSGLIKVANSDKLDYESYPGPKHRLVIVAKTDEFPPLYGYCEVVINLQDQNDNAPRFTQQQYTSNVHEGNAKRVFVMQLSAKDNDEGSNARVLYHIVDGNHDNAFIIEPAFSGSVKTNIVLDREIRETYKLTVIATDEGVPQLTGTATLRINVLDVNDNQPTFPPRSSITVSEGTEIGSVLTSVTANDVDSDPPLTYDLESEVDTFAIDRYSGKIILKTALDFETKQEYTLNVTASDSIYVAKTTLTIRVTDDNDNSPVFQKLSYYAVLTDGIGETELIAVNATDADSGENGNITYILQTADSGFRMDPSSGLLYVNHSSLSGRRDVVLTVAAVDNGKPQKRAITVIRVNSGATADMKPQIDKDNYRITVKEDFLLGEKILQIARSYYQDNKTIVEFLISSGNEDRIFELTNDTLILIKTLDRERQDLHVLQLSAVYDENVHYVGSNTSLITIHVKVEDANDNAPVFKQMEDEYTISERTSIGTVITKVTASDADLPGSLNSLIFYGITSGDDEDFFRIDEHSGIIKVNKTLDYDNGRNQFTLVACACDQGEPSLCTLNNIHIALTDENDNDPTFPITEYFEFVGENEPSGTSIFTARATDADKGEFGKLNYSMVSTTSGGYLDRDESWKLFRIDSRTGQVNTNSVFDYEQRNRYAFTIQAEDAGGKTATVRVRIEIESRDEFHPQFTQRTYRFTIPIPKSGGAIPAGYILGHVIATDRDKGPDGRVVYQLSSKNDPHFKINRTTGAIMTKKKIDDISSLLEEKRDISLVVTASSGRQGSLSNKTAVEITAGSLIDSIPESNLDNETAPSKAANGLADWALGLLIALILLIASFGGIFLFLHMKNRRNKKVNKPGLSSDGVGGSNSYVDPSAFDTIPIRGGTGVSGVAGQFAPPKYDEIPPYGPHTASSNSGAATTSELSGSEQSGSSGRGSAEEGEDGEDEEIRMINEGPLQRDSGIHRQTDDVDDDNLSDVSVHNTQEYLARLGIVDTATTGGASTSSRRCSESVGVGSTKDTLLHHGSVSIDPIHIFDEDATNENDITNLIYAKLNDVTGSDRASSADEVGAAVERAMVLGAFPAAPNDTTGAPTQGPSMTGSLSSIVHSEEELTGSYNWDYLLDWGPQYQPLAHVFSEIARLKDDAVSVQSANSGASSAKSKAASTSGTSKNAPPPLLTTVAPRSCPAPALTARQNQLLLPRSPISHDVAGGFSAAAAMSPSFSPSLSPLATRSPSISPLVPPGLHHARTHKAHHSSHVQHPIQDTTLRI